MYYDTFHEEPKHLDPARPIPLTNTFDQSDL
jgi:hypothetical protein